MYVSIQTYISIYCLCRQSACDEVNINNTRIHTHANAHMNRKMEGILATNRTEALERAKVLKLHQTEMQYHVICIYLCIYFHRCTNIYVYIYVCICIDLQIFISKFSKL